MPVRDFISGDRYSVVFAAPTILGIATSGTIVASHNSELFESNIVIDGLPARVILTDDVSYNITGNGIGGNAFLVAGNVSIAVTIDIGNTLVSLYNSLQITDPVTGMPPITQADTDCESGHRSRQRRASLR